MAYDVNLQTLTGIAGGALPQFTAVSLNNAGQYIASTAAANMDGILQTKAAAQGNTITYAYAGITKANLAAGATVAIGGPLEVGAGGNLVPHASGTIVAKALEASTAAAVVKTITVRLLQSNATF